MMLEKYELLSRAVNSGAYAHAYLFTSVNKDKLYELAIEFCYRIISKGNMDANETLSLIHIFSFAVLYERSKHWPVDVTAGIAAVYVITVSYTHLDVYKRQASLSSSSEIFGFSFFMVKSAASLTILAK